MSASSPSDSLFDPREPIPGYKTRELIGRGGFGEVWRAEAPGGLAKAIKIVHAGVDSKRAERELRALQRIRDVRHPLILSIERIELIAGTLVIVTELADGSLRDLFNKCREQGQPGIPRERLLALLKDAADALDYIYEEHSLQHLDIKPENLLLVGNRLKVGDFGLIKNIYERGASLVNGLTPTYAPPELFEGKPTKQSDQYSLAIVYQHMFTGELPFDGATPAQWAREHLAGVPRLTLLPRSERPIVARALAKSPSDRYTNCQSLIKALADALPEVVESDDSVATGADDLHTHTMQLPGALAAAGDKAASGAEGPTGTIDPLLGALEASLHPTRRPGGTDSTSRRSEVMIGSGYVPTVFIGVGGTGGEILQELRVRLEASFGPLKHIPALQMVLIDTDGRSLNVLMRDHDVCQSMDVAALPLRRPEDYRFRESRLSKWLHRRWVYNMPRSLSTEGYRPLGRLALVDHGSRVMTALKTAIAKAASAENTAKSTEVSGLPFRHGHVRIVLAASISGATGSGMLLDLAYAARGELKKRSLPDEDVIACLLHASPGGPAERDKAIANAYALLAELGHYSSPGHFYPGEPSIDVPQFHGDNRTFRSTYLVNVGEDVSSERWRQAATEAAEYLYLTAATPAKMVVDATRHADEGRTICSKTTVLVRSQTVHRLDCAYSHDVETCVAQACRDALTLWESGQITAAVPNAAERLRLLEAAGTAVDEAEAKAAAVAAAWLQEWGVRADDLMRLARLIVEQIWDSDETSYLQRLFQQLADEGDRSQLSRREQVERAVRIVDRMLSDAPAGEDLPPLCEELRSRLSLYGAELGAALIGRTRGMVDQLDTGVAGARAVASAVLSEIKLLKGELEARRRTANEQLPERTRILAEGPPPTPPSGFSLFRRSRPAAPVTSFTDNLTAYATERLDEARMYVLQQLLDGVGSQIGTLSEQLSQLSRELKCLSAEFPAPAAAEETSALAGPETQAFVQRIKRTLHLERERITRAVHDELCQTALAGEQRLQRFLGVRTDLQDALRGPLHAAAKKVVSDQVQRSTLEWIADSAREAAGGREPACGRLVAEFLAERRAHVRGTFGPVLVLVPDTVEPRVLNDAFASCKDARLVPARTNGVTVVAEIGARPLEDVADEVIGHQELYRQLAQKLHTREDVDWSPLPPPGKNRSDSVKVPGASTPSGSKPSGSKECAAGSGPQKAAKG
ncbi:MAG: tubulin-like doman-containing protein [Planctomycetaceae bacterium]